ncbi:BS5 [Sebaldella termitidis]|jgi:small subunit ribosomal protein S4|uniref:Small ribosomal subunit protein uS4 n=1 Tax=Sebaldella termitidis (strain ATCC 33386 / NCTC 11300) TaxID=526218 RepID=D1AGT0_SEBTE|nr:30S ribosomal protein S4 [Sebaldella termitidis]ACZ10800.1 ribosomal protein S4 [Sebaldella termitidis ATCC 33386]SUI26143.1 BS5 [Sebaldella termitidis]
MARDRQPVLKKCRTLGLDPSILGVNKKSKRGLRPNANKKLTDYGIQLREKQKARFVYGIMEKQFYKLYEEATRKEGVTGELLLQYLERRFDNVVYRLGLTTTRRQARQLVSHGHLEINGKRVNIASYRVKQGDVITVREKSRDLAIIKESLNQKSVPGWLTLDENALSAKVLENPTREAVDFDINEAMIIEFYSR